MPNKYENLTEPHKVIGNIFKNIGAGMEAGKKPADKAIEEFEAKFDKTRVEKKTSNKLLKAMLRDLKKEKVTLKKSLSKAGEFIEELKIVNKIQLVTNEALNKQNKLFRAQLRKFGQVFDNCGGKEVDAEFNDKEFNDYVNKKKGAK